MNQLVTDIRSGLRMLVKYPMLSIVAILTLGLGIGLGTTVFSVVNGGLFKGLPFDQPDRIVALVAANPTDRQPRIPISVHDVAVWQERLTVFEPYGAFGITALNLSTDASRPERFSAGELTAGAFDVLRVKPLLGRGFVAADDRPGADPVVL